LEEVKRERLAEIDRIDAHIKIAIAELITREDRNIGRLAMEAEKGLEGAAGLLRMAEDRHQALLDRRGKRREELERQRALSLQKIERVTSLLVLPHPDLDLGELSNLRSDAETEAIAMRVVIDYERGIGRTVEDVHEKNLGYDITSLDSLSGELRLIEVKGIASTVGTVALSPNERRVAEDRADCYWLYVVTGCKTPEGPTLQKPIANPGALPWHEVQKVDYYSLPVATIVSHGRSATESTERHK
jgi:hypothetical protein